MNAESPLLAKARFFSEQAHAGQTDRLGNPYAQHPAEVARRLTTEDEKIVAYLHDVVEDTFLTLDNLVQAGFPAHIIDAIDAITRRQDETYHDYISRIEQNPLATKVKLADLSHNLDPARKRGLTPSLEKRYISATRRLSNALHQ